MKEEKTTTENSTTNETESANAETKRADTHDDNAKTAGNAPTTAKNCRRSNATANAHMCKDDKTDFAIGLSVVLVIFAVFFGLIAFATSRTRGEIELSGNLRRGSEQTFFYRNTNLQQGDKVTWYVNGTRMTSYVFDGSAEFAFVPEQAGNAVVKVRAGNFSQVKVVNVANPVLTVTAKNVETVYGEELPTLEYECEGWVEGEDESLLNCRLGYKNAVTGCGNFEIEVEASSESYEVVCRNGTLTVKPRELTLKNLPQKIYDQTTAIDSASIETEGALDGDDVEIAGEWNFENKDAGLQKIDISKLTLAGADSANYTIAENIGGRILPREVSLNGLTVADKNYDGTTKAKIAKMGMLNGVLDGDSVAVGSLDVAFDAADIGTHKVNVSNVKLVGFDKDNYTLADVEVNDAEITE